MQGDSIDDPISLGLTIFQEEGQWVVQGLHYDICAQGGTLERALIRFAIQVEADTMLRRERGQAPFEGVPAAPAELWKNFRCTP